MPDASEATQRPGTIGRFESFLKDLKYSLRTLARTPGFTAISILTLALGIGANTAIFTLLDQVLVRLLAVRNPQQLVLLTMRAEFYGNNWGGNAISYPMFRDFQDHNEVFSSVLCRFPSSGSLTVDGRSERVSVELVSGTYFSTLGISPALGRVFTAEEDRVPNGEPYVVLSYNFWKSRFAGATIVGRTSCQPPRSHHGSPLRIICLHPNPIRAAAKAAS